jgi:hypothetical protein
MGVIQVQLPELPKSRIDRQIACDRAEREADCFVAAARSFWRGMATIDSSLHDSVFPAC